MMAVCDLLFVTAQVSILDVRGHIDTALVEPGVEQSTYLADYDAYLEGHIPVSATASHMLVSAAALYTPVSAAAFHLPVSDQQHEEFR
jgi:hypothetical protein